MKKALRIFAVLSLAAFAACNTVVQPQQSTPGDFNVDFSASDGTFSFDATNAAAYNDGSSYTVIGTSSNNSANMTVSGIPISSSVPYSVTSVQNSSVKVQYHDPSNNRDYIGNSSSGSCNIQITQTSPTLTGTFTAKLISNSFADTITVVSATFNAVLK